MQNIQEFVYGLQSKNTKYGCECMKYLEDESKASNTVYKYIDIFIDMLDSPNSYIRTRGLVLIAANAKWDTECKIDKIVDKYLQHIMDDKPITSRQCIKCLPIISVYKPDLIYKICDALHKASPDIYPSSMKPLIKSDIENALNKIKTM